MTTDDKEIWSSYTRGIKTTRKKPVAPSLAIKPAKKKISAAEPTPVPHGQPQPLPAHLLERTREKSMRRGEIEIEAKLDLHGMTQTEAFTALAGFMQKSAKSGKRRVLIITGKGVGGAGVLRGNLKDWLGQLPEAKSILALRPAAPAHGGAGAFYVILRARRS